MRTLAVVLAGLLGVGLLACVPGQDTANGGLAFTDWTVQSIAGTATLPDARPTMSFAPDGPVTGSDGCNQYGGTFHTDGQSIEVSQLTSTRMACPPEISAQAAAFTAALTGATEWRQMESGELELRGHGDIVATPGTGVAPDATPGSALDLADTKWVLVDLDGSAIAGDQQPTIAFGADGTASGFAGCNTFSGPYSTDGAAFDIGPLITTKMACQAPGGSVESAFLTALDTTDSWQIDDAGQLILGGPQPLTFTP